jgi:hypothetical protein
VEAVGSAADDAELVVQPLGESVGQAMSDVGEDAIEVIPEGRRLSPDRLAAEGPHSGHPRSRDIDQPTP